MAPQLELGESRLPELLKTSKLTQAEFARRMDTNRQFIHKIIKKERILSLEQSLNAAFILDCKVEDLYKIRLTGNRR